MYTYMISYFVSIKQMQIDKFDCQALVIGIDDSEGWHYKSCFHCRGGVHHASGGYECTKCYASLR